MDLLEQLTEFDLGRFLLSNKGLNGYWTSYIIQKAYHESISHPLEKWLLYDCPGVLATRERFGHFQKQINTNLQNNMIVASVPCGLMDDLLLLENKVCTAIKLVGIDLDQESLNLASAKAKKLGKDGATTFLHKDAWELNEYEAYDIITSNGLTIYESNKDRITGLYKEFFNALKKGGVLITSFLTPPPGLSNESNWVNFNPKDLLKQKVIYNDIIQVGWQSYQTETEIYQLLSEIGFCNIEIIYDFQCMFPTVVAKKQ